MSDNRRTRKERVCIAVALAVCMVLASGLRVAAQEFPTRPITLFVPFAPGGGTDLSVRMVEPTVSRILGQRLVVVNKPGTATVHQVIGSTPDGYTLTVGTTGNTATLPHNPGVPYAREDYVTVAQLTNVPAVFAAPAQSPFRNLADVADVARKNPSGHIKVGISALGSISHLAGIQVERAFDIKFTYVPHKSNGEVMNALLGGHVGLGSVDISSAGPRIRAGEVRGIAIFQGGRLRDFPELLTAREQGADVTIGFYNIVIGPRALPDRIVTVLHDAFKKALEDPEVQERSRNLNIPIAYLGPRESRTQVDRAYETFGILLRDLGLKK